MATAEEATAAASRKGKQVVLITGVSKGLGRALALELARYGHTIIGCSRNQTILDSLQLEVSRLAPAANHLLLNVDVRSNSSVEEFARTVIEKKLVPHIIGIVNKQDNMWEIDVEEFDNVIDTNIKGIANILRHFLPLMIPYNQGIIVNMSSHAGRNPYRLISPYCASKWAIEGLSKSIAKELPEGMAIVALDPGIINTDMLASCMGHHLASQYQSPHHWASKAATTILDLTTKDNGESLTIEGSKYFID